MLHNESVNVWSHLIGVGFFIGLLIWTLIFLSPFTNYLSISTTVADRENIINQAELMLSTHSNLGSLNNFEELCDKFLNISINSVALNEIEAF
jgi:hypothetical protein